MERQLLRMIVSLVREIVQRGQARFRFDAAAIVRVHYWAVLWDRPVSWACDPRNWPVYDRRRRLPSQSTMSRRLASPAIRTLLDELEKRVVRGDGPGGVLWFIDGKSLPIGGCSKDRQAGYGRAAGCMAKGYKLHAVVSRAGIPFAWRVTPMNKDERVMARRLLRDAEVQGYVLGDGHYDANVIHDVCLRRGNIQLVTRRRDPKASGLGHQRHSPARLRGLWLAASPLSAFQGTLLEHREQIERYFAQLTSFGGGLTHLPPWVRTHRRVRRWVQTKIVIHLLRRRLLQTTYVA